MVTESTSRQASFLRGWSAGAAGAVLLGLLALFSVATAARADDPLGIYIYTISRDGTPIGQQRMEFVNDGEKLRVLSHMDLNVSLLGMSLYGFRQQAEEVHADGKLLSLTSEADDDGKDRKVNMVLQGDLLKGDYNGNQRAVDPRLVTSLFWRKPTLGQTQVLDTVRGKVRDVTVKDLGPETLSLPVGRVETHHYQMTGEWKRDLWYDATGILVAGQRPGPDGSTVRLELQQRP
jgi:hypothetical protein